VLNFDSIDLDAIESIITGTIDSLPDRCKEVFLLSRFEGLKNAEIALQKDITVKAVEANITRALKLLKENLKDYLPSGLLAWLLEQLF
jgi:RNA polymerase sigma-70 factor (ECF subfamily)